MRKPAIVVLAALLFVAAFGRAEADQAYFARYGYDYPATWGIGPFASLNDCSQQLSSLYGAQAYLWHCEIRVYVSQPSYNSRPAYGSSGSQYYARYGYAYPAYWGGGPFDSLTECMDWLSRSYGADAYKWHCEIHV